VAARGGILLSGMSTRRWRVAGAVLATAVLSACSMAPERTPLAEPVPAVSPPGFSRALRASLPSVLGVYGLSKEADALGLAPEASSIGAGFFIDDAGHFVTAAHVVVDARRVLVKTADLQVFTADLVGHDAEADVAVMRLRGMAADAAFSAPGFGRSAASRAGDWVLAVGEPFGLQRSVVAGIVAGRTRHFSEDGGSFYIQSDLSLNPGNSGGPLLNAAGEVIGMNLRTVIGPFGAAGVSLSIPIEAVLQLAAELRQGGQPVRPRLGASFEDVSPPAAMLAGRRYASGALITRIGDGSMARRLGLQVGDIVVGTDGQPVEDSADFARWLMRWRGVEGTRLVVWRERRYELLAMP
jgi:serine protease Do